MSDGQRTICWQLIDRAKGRSELVRIQVALLCRKLLLAERYPHIVTAANIANSVVAVSVASTEDART